MNDNVIDFKKRSTGEVAAPIDDVRFKRPKYAGADEDREDDLVEKLATSVERARCAKIIRDKLYEASMHPVILDGFDVNDILRRIEKP